jgi:hypothetical protein
MQISRAGNRQIESGPMPEQVEHVVGKAKPALH